MLWSDKEMQNLQEKKVANKLWEKDDNDEV